MSAPVKVIAGHFGSGKTEFALNYAINQARTSKERVRLVDLDFVNPYFRSRRFRSELAELGVEMMEPQNREISVADIPSISSSMLALLNNEDVPFIIETGGDPIGARVLSSLSTQLKRRNPELMMVFNCFRPETDTPQKVKEMNASIANMARMDVHSLISNCHLKEFTTSETLLEGLAFTNEMAKDGLPISHFCVTKGVEIPTEVQQSNYSLFTMGRFNTYCYEEGNFSSKQI